MSYAVLLDRAHQAAGGVVVGPGGYAYATQDLLAGGSPVDQPVTESVGVSCVRFGAAEPVVSEVFCRSLLAAHVDLLDDVLAQAIDDLGRRSSDGRPLLSRQLVQAGIADAGMLVDQVRGLLESGELSSGVRAMIFRRLVHGGRALLRLLGGASFLLDGPGGTLMAAEMVGVLYLSGGSA
ncbi:hypothetical protein LWC34_10275 [Kibdelosporangium philippinense]|uniref:Uncharacterized protein n=1 Tax=Kibdelosporangium philippinense TaxID=211113 RepID=A0ABS8Z5P3_9PSEU|nr:hypothetical protein [Kibdelosporangium philippinense]MCE7003214.1 hypothetical protein [Kibdelosporangium philippinense]